ncbi:MAG: hypothetical protein GHCLOJNM_02849 [bacterium]|nr:hypothetical protein [bacterium]
MSGSLWFRVDQDGRNHTLSCLRWLTPTLAVSFLLNCGLPEAAHAQPFSSGSTGVDGPLEYNLPGPIQDIVFDPSTFPTPLDQDGDGVYHFTTIHIPANVHLILSAEILGTTPVVWLAQGDVMIEGIIDLTGANGHGPSDPRLPAKGGAGGYDGGVGGTALEIPLAGSGPGGGSGGGIGSGSGAGAGHFQVGAAGGGTSFGGIAYGNTHCLPLVGGSGGGGGDGSVIPAGGGGGGGGGGAILIATSNDTAINGSILASGGPGGGSTAGGGGGSGGTIRLTANRVLGNGTVNAAGGSAPFGGVGSVGRIRIESFIDEFNGTVSPLPIRSSPGVVFPPSNYPILKATTIGGTGVPESPQDDPSSPDVILNAESPVTLNLEAMNIPVGTTVRVRVVSEESPQQIITSSGLAGSFLSSTAQATINLPLGLSRIYLYASWDLSKSGEESGFLKEFPDDPIERIETEAGEGAGETVTRYRLKSGRTVEVPGGE